ncbi:MAG: hypothetical protein DWQ04_28275 [Chloroflexi bacterium]|nr:MAG: hypothetical protein DWQ04_28275 [Chloroflexota bacterium]
MTRTSNDDGSKLPVGGSLTNETLSAVLGQLLGVDVVDADRLVEIGHVLGGWQRELALLENELVEAAELPRCNAIRIDKDRRGLHRVGYDCPLHGPRPANGRLHPYNKKAKIQATHEAMANEKLFEQIEVKIRDKKDVRLVL